MIINKQKIPTIKSEVDLFKDEKRYIKYVDIDLFEVKESIKNFFGFIVVKRQYYEAIHRPTGIKNGTLSYQNSHPDSAIADCIYNASNAHTNTELPSIIQEDTSKEAKIEEEKAEKLYQLIKFELCNMDTKTTEFFWLKMLWYIKWNVSSIVERTIKEVEKEFKIHDCNDPDNIARGTMVTHVHRPYWIRPPKDGDEFDRGERTERLSIPL